LQALLWGARALWLPLRRPAWPWCWPWAFWLSGGLHVDGVKWTPPMVWWACRERRLRRWTTSRWGPVVCWPSNAAALTACGPPPLLSLAAAASAAVCAGVDLVSGLGNGWPAAGDWGLPSICGRTGTAGFSNRRHWLGIGRILRSLVTAGWAALALQGGRAAGGSWFWQGWLGCCRRWLVPLLGLGRRTGPAQRRQLMGSCVELGPTAWPCC